MKPKLQKALRSFASGVMIAVSVWSLLIPSIDMAEANGNIVWIPATFGYLFDIVFLLLLDNNKRPASENAGRLLYYIE